MQFQYQKEGPIGRITMVNPPMNALTRPDFADPEDLRRFLAADGLKAAILQGEGRHFCCGADPGGFAAAFGDPAALERALAIGKELLLTLAFAPIPVAAVIRGSCLGGGLELALACHFRFAAKTAMFGFPECGHKLLPGLGGTVFGREVLSRGRLIELVLSGRLIGAPEALALGLVDAVAAGKTIGQEATSFLETLTHAHPPKLIRTVMQSIHNGRRLPLTEALAEETRLFCLLAQDLVAAEAQRKVQSHG